MVLASGGWYGPSRPFGFVPAICVCPSLSPHNEMSPQAPGRRWRLLAFAGLAAILVTTLYPIPSAAGIADQTPLLCLVCGENGGADVIQNLLLFAPFAIGLRLYGWSWI